MRQQVVEHREDGLLHLAGVPGAPDQHDPLGEVDRHEGAAPGAVPRGVGVELGRVEHGEAGLEPGEVGGLAGG